MTTTDPKPTGFDDLDSAIAALGGYPAWVRPDAIAIPKLDPMARAHADRALADSLLRRLGDKPHPSTTLNPPRR
jgi:hypothetical protein